MTSFLSSGTKSVKINKPFFYQYPATSKDFALSTVSVSSFLVLLSPLTTLLPPPLRYRPLSRAANTRSELGSVNLLYPRWQRPSLGLRFLPRSTRKRRRCFAVIGADIRGPGAWQKETSVGSWGKRASAASTGGDTKAGTQSTLKLCMHLKD